MKQSAELDRFFTDLCGKSGQARMPSSAWPAVEERLDGRRPSAWSFLAAHPVLSPACAALLALAFLMWTHPGLAAEAVERIRKVFSGTFVLQVGRAKPVVKEMTMESGKPSSVEVGGKVVTMTMDEAGQDAVMLSVRVAEKSPAGAGKVLAKPKIVTRKGTTATISVTSRESGAPLFRVQVAPADPSGKAVGTVTEVK